MRPSWRADRRKGRETVKVPRGGKSKNLRILLPHPVFIGPADCNHYNCNRILLSESSYFQSHLIHMFKQFVVTVAVLTVCWSYEYFRTLLPHPVCITQIRVTRNYPGSSSPESARFVIPVLQQFQGLHPDLPNYCYGNWDAFSENRT